MSTPTNEVKAAVAAAETTLKAKVSAFVTAHYAKVVSAGAGYAAAKFGVIGLIWKLL